MRVVAVRKHRATPWVNRPNNFLPLLLGRGEGRGEESNRINRAPGTEHGRSCRREEAPTIRGLSQSVEGFEESHPKLVQAVNSICTTLSDLGI